MMWQWRMSNSLIVDVLKFGSFFFHSYWKNNYKIKFWELRSVKSTVYHYFSLNHVPVTWHNQVCMVEHTRLTLIRNLFFFFIVKTKLEFKWTLSHVSLEHLLSGVSGVGHADMPVPFLLRTKEFRLKEILRGRYVVISAKFRLNNICRPPPPPKICCHSELQEQTLTGYVIAFTLKVMIVSFLAYDLLLIVDCGNLKYTKIRWFVISLSSDPLIF